MALTGEAVAVKVALFAPCGTVTEEGTCSAVSLLERLIDAPPLPATVLLSVTVQVSVAAPVSAALAQETPLTLAEFLGAARSATGATTRIATTTAWRVISLRKCPNLKPRFGGGSTAMEREGASLAVKRPPKGGGNTKETIYLPRSPEHTSTLRARRRSAVTVRCFDTSGTAQPRADRTIGS